MAKKVALINGIGRMVDEAITVQPSIYDGSYLVVGNSALKSTAAGASLVLFSSPSGTHDYTSSFSCGIWAKSPTIPPSAIRTVYAKRAVNPAIPFSLQLTTGASKFRFLASIDSINHRNVTSSVPVVADTWYFIVCRYDSGTDTCSITVNGTTDTAFFTSAYVHPAAPYAFRVMGEFGSHAGGFIGSVDEICIYNTSIDTTLMDWLYNSGTPRNYIELGASEKTGLVSWYGFNLQSSTGQLDEHGNIDLFSDHNGTTKIAQYEDGVAPPTVTFGTNGVGEVESGTPIPLPNSQTYSDTTEVLEVFHNGRRLEKDIDYIKNSSTTVSLRFDLKAQDILRFRVDRGTTVSSKLKLINGISKTQYEDLAYNIYDQSINIFPYIRKATRFSGTGSGLRRLVNSSAVFNTHNISFSGGAWFKITNGAADRFIVGKGSGSDKLWQLRYITNSTLRFYVSSNGTNDLTVSSPTIKTVDVWHFAAWSYNYDEDTISISIDGGNFQKALLSSKLYNASTNPFFVGCISDNSVNALLGDVESVFIRNGIMTNEQVTSFFSRRHYSEFTVADKENLVAYWQMGAGNATHNDLHGSYPLTVSGAGPTSALTIADGLYLNQLILDKASRFNGGGVGITRKFAINNLSLRPSGSFSGSFWIKPRNFSTGSDNILGVSAASAGQRMYRLVSENDGRFSLAVSTDGTNQTPVYTPVLNNNQWYLVNFYYDQSLGEIGIGVDNQAYSTVSGIGVLHSSTADFYIGGHGTDDLGGLDADLDEVIMFLGVTSPSLRTKLYNSGSGIGYFDLSSSEQASVIASWSMGDGNGTQLDQKGSLDLTEDGTGTVSLVDGVVNSSVNPIPSGTGIPLPNGQTYDVDSDQLEVYLNGQRLESVSDYVKVNNRAIQLNFDLDYNDTLKFRIDRGI